jgi:hypothetical protein
MVLQLAAERDALQAKVDAYTRVHENKHAMAITPDVPAGFDTVLGYLAKYHPEILDTMDYTNPAATKRDGWWLMHRCKHYHVVNAPPVLRACGILYVNAWPLELLAQRWD